VRIDDQEVRDQGWTEERKAAWRIERLLEEQIDLLEQIVVLLTPPTLGVSGATITVS